MKTMLAAGKGTPSQVLAQMSKQEREDLANNHLRSKGHDLVDWWKCQQDICGCDSK